MTDAWSPLVLAGLGAFHGLNPAMGWLFAVALGVHRQSRAVVFLSLVPICVGHAVSIAGVASLLVVVDVVVPPNVTRIAAGILLLGWGAYHWRFGHRHRIRFGMQTGLWGLTAWSFLMATAHGAGVMLWPALMPLCLVDPAGGFAFRARVAEAFTGIGIHTLAMAVTTVVVAALVYEWLGLAVLRRAWLNADLVWRLALLTTGALLVLI